MRTLEDKSHLNIQCALLACSHSQSVKLLCRHHK